jgi:glutaconate CoA-transferase subunit B
LNSTVIGDYAHPKVRLPGSGGAAEIAINAGGILVIMRLNRRAFVERLDFLTSPGHIGGGLERDRRGMPGGGPQQVITDRALFTFDNEQREMMLAQLAPGETVEGIQAEVGWPLQISPNLEIMTPPTAAELAIIRQDLDPDGLYR